MYRGEREAQLEAAAECTNVVSAKVDDSSSSATT